MDIMAHSVWGVFRSLVLIGAGVYVGFTVLLSLMQSGLVYHPAKSVTVTPENIGLSYVDVTFISGDGLSLNGWWIPADDSRGILLYCHGNAGNICNRLEILRILNRLGMSTFIFDYRGYGNSEGRPDEEGTYQDAEAALGWIVETQECRAEDIVFLGRSLGGAVAARLAKHTRPRALILESSFTSIPDMGKALHPFLPVRLLSRFSYATIEYIKEVTCPVLVIHSIEDDLVPYDHGRRIFEAAPEPKTFFEISGGHNDGYLITGERYIEGVRSFLNSLDEDGNST